MSTTFFAILLEEKILKNLLDLKYDLCPANPSIKIEEETRNENHQIED